MYVVTRQRENMGPTQTITTDDYAYAQYAFNIAVKDGDIFAEIFDYGNDCQTDFYRVPTDWV